MLNLCELHDVALYNSICVIISLTYHCNIPSGVVVILFTVPCIQFLLDSDLCTDEVYMLSDT